MEKNTQIKILQFTKNLAYGLLIITIMTYIFSMGALWGKYGGEVSPIKYFSQEREYKGELPAIVKQEIQQAEQTKIFLWPIVIMIFLNHLIEYFIDKENHYFTKIKWWIKNATAKNNN